MIAADAPGGPQRHDGPRRFVDSDERSQQVPIDQLLQEQNAWLYRRVRSTALRYHVDADKLLQETLLSLLRASTSLDPGDRGLRTWLAQRVEWSATNLRRQQARDLTADDLSGIDLANEASPTPSPAQELRDTSINQRRLQEVGLTRDQAQTLAMRTSGFDLSLRELAELLDRSYAKTRQDYARGLRRVEAWIRLTPTETQVYTAYRRYGSVEHAAARLGLPEDELRSHLQQANQKIHHALAGLEDQQRYDFRD